MIIRRKLRFHVKSLGKRPSITQKNDLAERRHRLKIRIDKFHREANKIIHIPEEDFIPVCIINDGEDIPDLSMTANEIQATDDDIDWEPEVDDEETVPEAIQLLLPSTLTHARRTRLQIEEIATQEVQLREGQANDALEGVRNSLAQVSLVFRTKVRESKSVYTRTRSWNEVQRSNLQVQQHVSRYRTARNALIQLRAPSEILDQFLEVRPEHMKMPGDIIEANRIGQRSDSLAWFWRLDADRSGTQEGWMKECWSQPIVSIANIL